MMTIDVTLHCGFTLAFALPIALVTVTFDEKQAGIALKIRYFWVQKAMFFNELEKIR